MTDQRPQYGEIATIEEQRRAAGLPPSDEIVDPVPPTPVAAEAAPDAVRSKPVDRFVTIALLAYGLVNVIMSGLSYLDFAKPINQAMEMLGIEGEFTNFAQGKLWGTIAAIVLVVGWSITAVLSIRRLRRGKLTWWVPLVGAAVTVLIASMCAAVPLMGDPAFIEFVSRTAGQ